MGIYLNPGNDSFKEAIRSKIYVDKTGMIACTNERINTSEKYICISRPRRFGKSMALGMLAAWISPRPAAGMTDIDLQNFSIFTIPSPWWRQCAAINFPTTGPPQRPMMP